MGALLSALFNFLTNFHNATRLILYALFVFVLPIILWNLWVEISEFILFLLLGAFSSVSVDVSAGSLSFSFSSLGPLAVWFASNLRIPEAFVAFISGLTIRITVDVLMRLILR